MDQQDRDLMAAFGMGLLGAPPVGVSDAEAEAGQKGLDAARLLALFERVRRALLAIDAAHPELGIHAAMCQAVVAYDGDHDLLKLYTCLSELVRANQQYLPE